MPYRETPGELAEAIADMAGIYNSGPTTGDHDDECPCRICFVMCMADRIRDAVRNERDEERRTIRGQKCDTHGRVECARCKPKGGA